jgi:hypothetical protein
MLPPLGRHGPEAVLHRAQVALARQQLLAQLLSSFPRLQSQGTRVFLALRAGCPAYSIVALYAVDTPEFVLVRGPNL